MFSISSHFPFFAARRKTLCQCCIESTRPSVNDGQAIRKSLSPLCISRPSSQMGTRFWTVTPRALRTSHVSTHSSSVSPSRIHSCCHHKPCFLHACVHPRHPRHVHFPKRFELSLSLHVCDLIASRLCIDLLTLSSSLVPNNFIIHRLRKVMKFKTRQESSFPSQAQNINPMLHSTAATIDNT